MDLNADRYHCWGPLVAWRTQESCLRAAQLSRAGDAFTELSVSWKGTKQHGLDTLEIRLSELVVNRR